MGVRSFAVGAYVGRKAAGFPFARLDVADDSITVRCWPLPWFGAHTVSKNAILEISLQKNLVLDHLKFIDSDECFARVSVDLPIRPKRVISELKARGYRWSIVGPPRFFRRASSLGLMDGTMQMRVAQNNHIRRRALSAATGPGTTNCRRSPCSVPLRSGLRLDMPYTTRR